MSVAGSLRVESRRLPVLIGLVVLAVLAGVANSTVKAHRAASISGPLVGLSTVYEHSDASSSAWYCAGPLPRVAARVRA